MPIKLFDKFFIMHYDTHCFVICLRLLFNIRLLHQVIKVNIKEFPVERNVNCLNSKVIIEYVKRQYPKLMENLLVDIDPFFDNINDVEEFLQDEHNWISQRVCTELFERIRLYSGQADMGMG